MNFTNFKDSEIVRYLLKKISLNMKNIDIEFLR